MSDNYSIQDHTLNYLIRLSKDNNIKVLRQYISLNKRYLKCYKTRLLNNVIHLDCYKFTRRDDKFMIIKLARAKPSQLASLATNDEFVVEPVKPQYIVKESVVPESQTKDEPQETYSKEQSKTTL